MESTHSEGHGSVKDTLVLFVVGGSANSTVALINLRRMLDRTPEACPALEIVDISEESDRAMQSRVFVTPTLLWKSRPFQQRLIGDLSSESDLRAFLATK